MTNSSCANTAPLIVESPIDSVALSSRATHSLKSRLDTDACFDQAEIRHVEDLSKTLFPPNFVISEEHRERFRTLCAFSQTRLRPAREITSHRRFIGPVIVLVKRLSWPFIELHLRDTFRSLAEFNARSVEQLAALIVSQERTQKTVANCQDQPNSK